MHTKTFEYDHKCFGCGCLTSQFYSIGESEFKLDEDERGVEDALCSGCILDVLIENPPTPTVVIVEVTGGVADCTQKPEGIELQIIDHDNADPMTGEVEPQIYTVEDKIDEYKPE